MIQRTLSALVLCTAVTACSKGGAKKDEAAAKQPPAAPTAPAPTAPTPTPSPTPAPTAAAAAAGALAKLDLAAPELDVGKQFAGQALAVEHGSLPDEVWDVLWVRDGGGKQVLAAHVFTDAGRARAVNLVAAAPGLMPSQGDVGMSFDDLRQKVPDLTCVYPDDGESPITAHRTHTEPSKDWVVCYSPREGGDRNPFAYVFIDDGKWKVDGASTAAPAGAAVAYVAWEDDKRGPTLLGLPAAAAKPAP
ncbi:MAG: hypothetical protein JNK64_07340 [Myxococcales bacterium]|nr:hypothetical protein [Myxococcales bacterium]